MKTITMAGVGLIMLSGFRLNSAAPPVEITNATVISVTAGNSGVKENAVVLSWTSKMQTGSTVYEIERAFYSDKFETVASLQMPFTSGTSSNFCINDKTVNMYGRLLVNYRIKQVSSDGSVFYSDTKVVNLKETQTDRLQNNYNISFTSNKNGSAMVRIKDLTGHEATKVNFIVTGGLNVVDLGRLNSVSKGVYVAETMLDGSVINTQKLVID